MHVTLLAVHVSCLRMAACLHALPPPVLALLLPFVLDETPTWRSVLKLEVHMLWVCTAHIGFAIILSCLKALTR